MFCQLMFLNCQHHLLFCLNIAKEMTVTVIISIIKKKIILFPFLKLKIFNSINSSTNMSDLFSHELLTLPPCPMKESLCGKFRTSSGFTPKPFIK